MGQLRLSVAIQHHPARAGILSGVISALTPISPEVVRDPDPDGNPSSWRTYELALRTTPAWATHRLILQDDTRPCRGFAKVVARAIEARPDRVLVLCLCGRPIVAAREAQRAYARGEAWVELRRNQWVPTLALVWPADLIPRVLAYVESQRWPERFTADDERIARALQGLREPAPLAACPSIVQHPDVVPSILGARHKNRAGADEGRVAFLFADDVGDALRIDWSTGAA